MDRRNGGKYPGGNFLTNTDFPPLKADDPAQFLGGGDFPVGGFLTDISLSKFHGSPMKFFRADTLCHSKGGCQLYLTVRINFAIHMVPPGQGGGPLRPLPAGDRPSGGYHLTRQWKAMPLFYHLR